MSRDLDPDDVASDDTLQTFHSEIYAHKDKYKYSPMLVIGHNAGEHSLDITTAGEICPGRSCFIPKARTITRQASNIAKKNLGLPKSRT